ncbi:MAG TPA: GNAT family protein [Streptosporangiaceae bacterium]|nr:GNAT family protein [Streptosporangiaceae bacterium]
MVLGHQDMILHIGARVMLRRLSGEDRDEYLELVRASAEFLSPWVYLPATPAKFDQYLKGFDGKDAECTLICQRESGAIVGAVSISQIIRDAYQRATVGYNAFIPWVGRGYMSEGFSLVFRFAFLDLGLHRLEADIQPGNEPSLKFAENVGFRREGYSPGFVYINGEWRDHERWAITRDMIE